MKDGWMDGKKEGRKNGGMHRYTHRCTVRRKVGKGGPIYDKVLFLLPKRCLFEIVLKVCEKTFITYFIMNFSPHQK